MEPNYETSFSSYYHNQQLHHHHNNHNPTAAAAVTNAEASIAATSPTNGFFPPNSQLGYPNSTATTAIATPPETVRRKRGRPRKYETPEEASAARKAALVSAAAAAAGSSSTSGKKKDQATSFDFLKKPKVAAIGEAGRDYTPHIINVATGEDVAQKIMLFMQQSKREICILSALGSLSNASLRQPGSSGGIVYEGLFVITSFSGSYIRTDNGGRTGGLSICLSSSDGQIVGGGVGGPLKAATPVQVIVGTFLIDGKRDTNTTLTGNPYTDQSASHADGLPLSFRSPVSSTGRIPFRGNEDQTIGTHFMAQPRGIHRSPSPQTEWATSQMQSRGVRGSPSPQTEWTSSQDS